MCGASSPHSEVTVGAIPTTSHNSRPKLIVFDWAVIYMTVTFLSHMIAIDWSNDGIQLVYLGPKMGIDRVQPHHLIQMDWAQNLSR